MASGAQMSSATAFDLVYTNRNGRRIFWCSANRWGWYNVATDAFTAEFSYPEGATVTYIPRMAWDGGQYLYLVAYPSATGTRCLLRYDLDADTGWVTLPETPTSSIGWDAQAGVVIDASNVLWIHPTG